MNEVAQYLLALHSFQIFKDCIKMDAHEEKIEIGHSIFEKVCHSFEKLVNVQEPDDVEREMPESVADVCLLNYLLPDGEHHCVEELHASDHSFVVGNRPRRFDRTLNDFDHITKVFLQSTMKEMPVVKLSALECMSMLVQLTCAPFESLFSRPPLSR